MIPKDHNITTMYKLYFQNKEIASLDSIPEKKGIYHYKTFDLIVCANFIVLGHCDRIDPVPKGIIGVSGLTFRIKSFRRFDRLYILDVKQDGFQEKIFIYDDPQLMANSVSSRVMLFDSTNVPKINRTFSRLPKKSNELVKTPEHDRWYDPKEHLYIRLTLPTIEVIKNIDFDNPHRIGNLFVGSIIIHDNIVKFLSTIGKNGDIIYINESKKVVNYMFYRSLERAEFHIIFNPDLTHVQEYPQVTNEEIDNMIGRLKNNIRDGIMKIINTDTKMTIAGVSKENLMKRLENY